MTMCRMNTMREDPLSKEGLKRQNKFNGTKESNDIVNKSEFSEQQRQHGRRSNRQSGQGRKAHDARSEREQSTNDQIDLRKIYCINVLD